LKSTDYGDEKGVFDERRTTVSDSKLVSYVKWSPNYTAMSDKVNDTVTIHCVVGQVTVERLGEIFAKRSKNASSNYGIGFDGKVGQYVREKDRSWCTSSAKNDSRAITIEVASDTTHPYKVTDAAFESLINLLADICKRNKITKLLWKGDKSLIGQIDKQNMTVHRWFANKACPGDYLYERHTLIAERVNQLLGVAEEPKDNTTFMYHTVRKNESMSKIASLYGVPLQAVIDANPQYKNPSLIRIGDVITVPVNTNIIPKTYTVISGDTLSKVGQKTGVDWHKIAKLNNIKFPYLIRKGQVLKLT